MQKQLQCQDNAEVLPINKIIFKIKQKPFRCFRKIKRLSFITFDVDSLRREIFLMTILLFVAKEIEIEDRRQIENERHISPKWNLVPHPFARDVSSLATDHRSYHFSPCKLQVWGFSLAQTNEPIQPIEPS